MSMNQRRRKYLKRKFAAYILLLGVLGVFAFFLNIFFVSNKPLFISPLGEVKIDKTLVEKSLKNRNILFFEVILSDYAYLINIPNNGQVRLDLNKDIDEQISSLQRILKELTIVGKSFKNIDFRFEEPIISF